MDTTVSYMSSLTDQTEDVNSSDAGNVTQSVEGSGEGGLTDYHLYLLNHSDNLLVYMSPILIVAGTLGNITSIVILCSARFKGSPSSMMMIILALMDTGNLNTGLLRHWINKRFSLDVRALTTAGCKIHMFATYLFGCMCGWSLVLLTLERTVSVLYPLKARKICSRNKMTIAFVVITVFLFLVNCHILVFSRLVQMANYTACQIEEKHYDLVMNILYWQDMLLSSAVPSGLIFIGNALIIYRLTTARIRRRQTMNVDNKQAGGGSITFMLIVISFMFLLTTLPIAIFFFQRKVWFDLDTQDGLVKQQLTYTVVNMFYYGNNMINFWLYFLSGRKFRQTFVALFCPCRRQHTLSTTVSSLSVVNNRGGTTAIHVTSQC